jgi:diaminohydroxyphosphoribosylaminopyrimidine deaminase / 5-amino-6-(5-phosphoribosylamino)uracil reductase
MTTPGQYLDLAARLALRAAGDVEPNPMVGAVIVKDDRIIGLGHHKKYGGLHAEREAIADCLRRGHSTIGSTIYTTLEPCRHHGKQPPCTDAVIEAGIARVIVAHADPNPVSRDGAGVLRRAGIPVEFCSESRLAIDISEPFIKRTMTGLPWVIAKWAQTLDGKIATGGGESKWISGELSRARVHRLRARVDAIICGVGTILTDDALLTGRGVPRIRRVARRVVLDTKLKTPLTSALVRTAHEAPVIIVCDEERLVRGGAMADAAAALRDAGVEVIPLPTFRDGMDIRTVLRILSQKHSAANVLFEAGPRVLGSLLGAGLADELMVYVAPMVFGDEWATPSVRGMITPTIARAPRFELRRMRRRGADVELTYRAANPSSRSPTTDAPNP